MNGISTTAVPGPKPHGGVLQNLLMKGDDLVQLKKKVVNLPALTLNHRQICDIELLINGGFSPLTGFMDQATYTSVVETMRLTNGLLWPMPITLDTSRKKVDELLANNPTKEVALRDEEQNLLGIMRVDDVYEPDRTKEALKVFGTTDELHPAVAYLFQESGEVYLGGPVFANQLPIHYDYAHLRRTPLELRNEFVKRGWTKVVAFQTRNPMHRAHRELTVRAAQHDDGDGVPLHLLLHPVVGMTKPGDVDYHTRVKCYEQIMTTYPPELGMLSLNPLAMRMGGPREALWHAILRKNFGCTHFIVGRDHAGPGDDKNGKSFYDPYEAQELALKMEPELEIKILPFQMMVFVEAKNEYYPIDQVPPNEKTANISGTKLRQLLRTGGDIPEWFTYPEVSTILRKTYPPRHKQGYTIFFTGLSGSGKSTIANALYVTLLEEGSRSITLLDGDVVRTHLSTTLGFSKEHRDLNVKRIGYVASEITKCGGVAIAAPIAPYESSRKYCRQLISQNGGFIEVHVATAIEVCEARDRKGLYAKARSGQLKNFTGIDDPYEVPADSELRIDTANITVKMAVNTVVDLLRKEGFLTSK